MDGSNIDKAKQSTYTEPVLKIMDAGYCLMSTFMKNIKSLKPFNFNNSNQLRALFWGRCYF